MENIPRPNVSLSKRPIFIFVTQHKSHPIHFAAQPSACGKKTNLIAPTLLCLSISHGNLNCHNKIFFQDLSSNSLSFLPKWLLWEGERHKSRPGIVMRNRWTLNHRWFWERAKRSLPLRKKEGEGGKTASTLSRNSKCFCVCEHEPGYSTARSIDICHRALWDCRLCYCAVPGQQCFLYVQRGTARCSLTSPADREAKSEFW